MYDTLRQLFSGISWYPAGGNVNATCSLQVHSESTSASYNGNTSRWTGAVTFQLCVQSKKADGPQQNSEHHYYNSTGQMAQATAKSSPPAALALTTGTYQQDEQQVQSFRKCLAVTWENLAALLTIGKKANQQDLLQAACQFLMQHSQYLSPVPSSPQFAWKWILLTDAAGCTAATQSLINDAMQSKPIVAACSTAVLAMLSENSKQHIQALILQIKKTATTTTTTSSSNGVSVGSNVKSSSRQEKHSKQRR